MISGLKTRIEAHIERGLRPARWALVALLCAAAPAWALDLNELMGLLAKQKQGEANFTEQRYVRGFDGPLAASGTLSFTAPDQLVRRTLSRSGRSRSMALDSMPELQGMVEAMRATLAGNTQVLQRYFTSTVGGNASDWTLDLAPIDARLASQVAMLRLSGKAGEVLGVEMEFRGGDRSVMTISPKR